MLPCYLLIVAAALVNPTRALLCDEDTVLADVQEYSYTIPHDVSDLDYWRTYHMAYMAYGEFNEFKGNSGEDTTIEAGYYTADGNLIYSTTVDCESDTWKTSLTNANGDVETRQTGDLEQSCETSENGLFDIWLKVQQPYMMNWLFNGEGLQEGIRTTYYNGKGRDRPHNVSSLYGADEASYFKVTATGTAILTRFAFGKCITWPEVHDSNCTAAANWVEARSKSSGSGQGDFGANMVVYLPDCYNEIYFNWLQSTVHPDRECEHGSAYCCCTYMMTGKLYDEGCSTTAECKALYCVEDYLNACDLTCVTTTYNSTLIS